MHCCPSGYTCSDGDCQQTKSKTAKIRLTTTHQAISEQVQLPTNGMLMSLNTTCKDGVICNSAETCCPSVDNKYACCNAGTNAVCCPDHVHCCPSGYTCDQANNLCIKFDTLLLFDQLQGTDHETVCLDGTTDCPDRSTCCKAGSRSACCPVEHAVCCSDEVHCCPSGYKCDLSLGACVRSVSLVALHAANTAIELGNNIPCGESSCVDGNTCCGGLGLSHECCPLPNAVCCSDGIHCCPKGFKCGVSGVCVGTGEMQETRSMVGFVKASTSTDEVITIVSDIDNEV